MPFSRTSASVVQEILFLWTHFLVRPNSQIRFCYGSCTVLTQNDLWDSEREKLSEWLLIRSPTWCCIKRDSFCLKVQLVIKHYFFQSLSGVEPVLFAFCKSCERRSCSSQWGQSWGRRDVLEERWRCCLHRRQHRRGQHRPVQFQLRSQPVILLSWCNYKLTFIWLMVLPGNFKGWSTTTERLKSITVLGQLQERFLWLKKTALFCAALNSTLSCLPIQLPQEGAPSSG